MWQDTEPGGWVILIFKTSKHYVLMGVIFLGNQLVFDSSW